MPTTKFIQIISIITSFSQIIHITKRFSELKFKNPLNQSEQKIFNFARLHLQAVKLQAFLIFQLQIFSILLSF